MEKLGKQAGLTIAFGTLLGVLGALGVRKISRLSAPLSTPIKTALFGGVASTLTQVVLERQQVGEKLKARFGDGPHYEEICFMAATFFGTAFLTYNLGPKLSEGKISLSGTVLYSTVVTSGAIAALLLSSDSGTSDA